MRPNNKTLIRYFLFLVLLSLTGCSTMGAAKVDVVSFDRGAFALSYAGLVDPMLAKCAKSKEAATPQCAQLTLLDQQVRQAIIDAPAKAATQQSSPIDALLPLIMRLAPLAAGL